MNLNVTYAEFEAGKAFKRINQKKLLEWQNAVNRKGLVKLKTPHRVEAKTYHAAVLLGFEPENKGYNIIFKPIWGRAYRGCHARVADLRILVLELQDDKVQIDQGGVEKCMFTTNGEGVGREAEEEAEHLLGVLAGDHENNPIIYNLHTFLSKKYA